MYLFLENIRSAYNVGSAFRVADGAGARGIILGGYTAYPPHKKISKTALGAEEHVPFGYVRDYQSLFEEGKSFDSQSDNFDLNPKDIKDYSIVVFEISSEAESIFDFQFPEKTIGIFGNEVDGVSDFFTTRADSIVYLPMNGIKDSLNVASSLSIASYEWLRQQKKV